MNEESERFKALALLFRTPLAASHVSLPGNVRSRKPRQEMSDLRLPVPP